MKKSMSKIIRSLALAAATAIFGVSNAHAGFTTIKSNALEDNQLQVIQHQYGGSWHRVGDDFYNGGMSAKRIDDYMTKAGVMNIANGQCGYNTDQTWCSHSFIATAVAKFSLNQQIFGTKDSGGNKHMLMDVQGYGYNIDHASKT